MIQWFKSFQLASPKTKWFILTWFVFGLAIAASTVFVYARIDYVRSGKTTSALQK